MNINSERAYEHADRTAHEPQSAKWWIAVAEYHHRHGQWTEAQVAVAIANAKSAVRASY